MEIVFKAYVTIAGLLIVAGMGSVDSSSILVPMILVGIGFMMLAVPYYLANKKGNNTQDDQSVDVIPLIDMRDV